MVAFFSHSLITVQAARKLEFVMISFHFTSLHFFALFGETGPLLLWFHTKFPDDGDAGGGAVAAVAVVVVVLDDGDDVDNDADYGDATLLCRADLVFVCEFIFFHFICNNI